MSGHQCSLGKLAQRGARLQISPLASSVRSFYHGHSHSLHQLGQVSQPGRANHNQMNQMSQWSSSSIGGSREAASLERNSRVRNIVGVKKTPLVSQMHSLGPAKVPPYRIQGKARLFSSSSSLSAARSQQQLQQQQAMMEEEEDEEEAGEYGAERSHTTASMSATQRRYNQAEGFGKGMAIQAAKDISRSIQEELMVVDAETRDMLNCDPGRQALRDYHEHVKARRQRAPVDPMQGWKHPRALKSFASQSASISDSERESERERERESATQMQAQEMQDERHMRPRRRQIVTGHASRGSIPLKQPELHYRSNYDLFSPNAREKFSDHRSELRPQTSWHSPKAAAEAVEEQPQDLLMDVSLARAVRPDITVARGMQKPAEEQAKESGGSYYQQPKAERDFLRQAFLGAARSRRKAGQSRSDELHSEAAENAAQMSASQHVINQKYAGYRQSSGQKHPTRQFVESVNPTPQLNRQPRAFSEPRDSRRRRGGMKQGAERQATPQFFGELQRTEATEDEDNADWGEKPTRPDSKRDWPTPHHSLLQMSSRSDSRLDSETRESGDGRETRGSGRSGLGERRGTKTGESAVERNDIAMPPNYRKESAVQRLGAGFPKYSSRAFNSY
ncbi:uncharacterized protein LOC108090106 [Drosophila ficusphila]|uniref:uncharacterized protein LOC108090106 n=1 Tax=Drosophila ficusphila TaxID=30025 RepID=UPI0007E89F82|nr:uncharacterized protein LOC108090106 [Drosophila ficusphila]